MGECSFNQYAVENFERIESAKSITMMTPEPDGEEDFDTSPRPSPRSRRRGRGSADVEVFNAKTPRRNEKVRSAATAA